MVDMDRVDWAGLASIQMARAVTDPIIVHPSQVNHDWHGTSAGEDVPEARLLQLAEAASGDPVKLATWAETAIYLSSVSLHVPLDHDGYEMYLYAFHKWLETTGRDVDQVDDLLDLDAPVTPPTNRVARDNLMDLRKRIKVSRDRWFLEGYDPDHFGVPKSFWTEWHVGPASRDYPWAEMAPTTDDRPTASGHDSFHFGNLDLDDIL